MTRRDFWMLLFCAAALSAAAVSVIRYWRGRDTGQAKVFFYDLSERKLFTAPSTMVPPIKGLNDAEEDAVRAVVISTNGNPKDKSSWRIAYLETCSPELKREFETAQREGTAPVISRVGAQTQRFVKRVGEARWVSMNSAEAGAILNEWLTAGPGGGPATICAP